MWPWHRSPRFSHRKKNQFCLFPDKMNCVTSMAGTLLKGLSFVCDPPLLLSWGVNRCRMAVCLCCSSSIWFIYHWRVGASFKSHLHADFIASSGSADCSTKDSGWESFFFFCLVLQRLHVCGLTGNSLWTKVTIWNFFASPGCDWNASYADTYTFHIYRYIYLYTYMRPGC